MTDSNSRVACGVDTGSIDENEANVGMGDTGGVPEERCALCDVGAASDSREVRRGPIRSANELVLEIKESMCDLPLELEANCEPVL
jgi:hypothetical protein